MAFWLYQMSAKEWSHGRYRAEVWEGNDTTWDTKKIAPAGSSPELGDVVVLFYAPTVSKDPGVYGWAIVLWCDGEEIRFRPASPSDHLKMNPLWDDRVGAIIDQIRGKVAQGTMWKIPIDLMGLLRQAITQHV